MLSVDIEKKLAGFRLKAAFEAEPGVTGILGASGCGKSMTLRCIAGIDVPDSGSIALDGETLFDSGRRINVPPQKRRIGYLFQNYALFPNMPVKMNIMCGLCREKDPARHRAEFGHIVKLLQLEGLEDRYPAQLSGGQAQRVALARILVNKPRLLMLDEPFSALDSHLREILQIEMKRLLQQYGGTVLMVTHSRDEAYLLCGRIAPMAGGSILPPKPAKDLFADPGSVAAAEITGCKNIAAAVKTGEYEVEVPDWGLRLKTARPVKDGVCAIGVRAHYFSGSAPQNRHTVRKTEEMEDPFEWTILFRYNTQKEGSHDVWWRMPKELKPARMPESIGIDPSDIQLLYPYK